MAPREIRHYLDDMLPAIDGIQRAIAGQDFETFRRSWVVKRAIERGIEIISEASRGLPPEIQATRPEIPWVKVRAIGNVLRHEYHHLSELILWNLVLDELPRLETAIRAILADHERG